MPRRSPNPARQLTAGEVEQALARRRSEATHRCPSPAPRGSWVRPVECRARQVREAALPHLGVCACCPVALPLSGEDADYTPRRDGEWSGGPLERLMRSRVERRLVLVTDTETPAEPAKERTMGRAHPRRWSAGEKRAILAQYDAALATGVYGAGAEVLRQHAVTSARVCLWRQWLAGLAGLAALNTPEQVLQEPVDATTEPVDATTEPDASEPPPAVEPTPAPGDPELACWTTQSAALPLLTLRLTVSHAGRVALEAEAAPGCFSPWLSSALDAIVAAARDAAEGRVTT